MFCCSVVNFSKYLAEADSKKKKVTFPGHSEDGEPEAQEAPAKGISPSLEKHRPLRLEEGSQDAPSWGWTRLCARSCPLMLLGE